MKYKTLIIIAVFFGLFLLGLSIADQPVVDLSPILNQYEYVDIDNPIYDGQKTQIYELYSNEATGSYVLQKKKLIIHKKRPFFDEDIGMACGADGGCDSLYDGNGDGHCASGETCCNITKKIKCSGYLKIRKDINKTMSKIEKIKIKYKDK